MRIFELLASTFTFLMHFTAMGFCRSNGDLLGIVIFAILIIASLIWIGASIKRLCEIEVQE